MRLALLSIVITLLLATSAGTPYYSHGKILESESSREDIEHFKYGSIGAEVNGYPYVIWKVLPNLFPKRAPRGWETFGFSYEPGRSLPVGISVRQYGVARVGFNCATCHTSTINGNPDIILGAPANKLDLEAYLRFIIETSTDPRFTSENIFEEISKAGAPLGFFDRMAYRFYIIPKLIKTLQMAANDNRWRDSRPQHGPGRTDALNPWRQHFGMNPEADNLVGTVDLPSLWNQKIRSDSWLHWDGNNRSLHERNLSAALAGGATEESLDHAAIELVALWSSEAPAPQYPFAIDPAKAALGEEIYINQGCPSCHELTGPFYGDVTDIKEIGTDRQRLDMLSEQLLRNFATVGQGLLWQFKNYRRSSGYANSLLDGIWARAPYLHNGSVPTLHDLFMPPDERPSTFYRGCDTFDPQKVGFVCESGFRFDVTKSGNGNGGHRYGTTLSHGERSAIIEYLKTK